MDRPLGDPKIAIEILRQENAALRKEVDADNQIIETLEKHKKMLQERVETLEAALSRYREAVEDVEGMARHLCNQHYHDTVYDDIRSSERDRWNERARAVWDYIKRRAGEG